MVVVAYAVLARVVEALESCAYEEDAYVVEA
jgi:hypothetical protein